MLLRGCLAGIFLLLSCFTFAEESILNIDNEDQLTEVITKLNEKNEDLRQNMEYQKAHLTSIVNEQNNINTQISHVQNTLATLAEQGEWLSFSTALGETLRQQLLRLPEKPKSQPLDAEIAEAKVQQLNYSNTLAGLDNYPVLSGNLNNLKTASQYRRLIREQGELLKTLISGIDTTILELTKLKISNKQLTNAIDEVNDAAHRFSGWRMLIRFH